MKVHVLQYWQIIFIHTMIHRKYLFFSVVICPCALYYSNAAKIYWFLWSSMIISRKRAIQLNKVAKKNLRLLCFALLRYVIGPQNSRHFLNQSDLKLKPVVTWSHAFSRASGGWTAFTSSSHWHLVTFPFLWLVVVIVLGLVLWNSIENCSIVHN